MSIVYPEGVSVLGNIKVNAVTTIADLAAPKVATEVKAVTSVELSCALMSNGWMPTTTQGKSTKPRRLCSTSDTEQLSPATHSIGTLLYSVGDPQSPNTSIAALLVEGAKVYLVERLGLDADTDWASTQKVRTHYVLLGKPYPIYDTSADNAEFHIGVEVVYVNDGPVAGTLAT